MPFYAVKKGRIPGVYTDWPSCQEQVVKYQNAVYKKFMTEDEAWSFVKGNQIFDVTGDTGGSKEVPDPAFPNSSPHQSQQFEGPSKEKCVDHSTASESIGMLRATAKTLQVTAEQLLHSVSGLNAQIDHLASSLQTGSLNSTVETFTGGAGVRDHLKRSYSDFAPLGRNDGAHGSDSGAKATKRPKKAQSDLSGCTEFGFTGVPFPDHDGKIVYTDGASFNNGYATARAGIGIFWGQGDPYNRSERLSGRQTNNRAEIHAAVIAVEQAKERGIKNLILFTDSQFVINGITMWIKKWKKNGWKLSTGGDVINREDFEKLDSAIAGMNIKWMHVRGHQGNTGNEAADRLANEGAKKSL